MIELSDFTSAKLCILATASAVGFAVCPSSIKRMSASRIGRAEKKRTWNFTLTAWFVAPWVSRLSSFDVVRAPFTPGALVGENIISDASVSVCVCAHGDFSRMSRASFFDHSVHFLSAFWAIVLASTVKRISVAAIMKLFLFIGGCLSAKKPQDMEANTQASDR